MCNIILIFQQFKLKVNNFNELLFQLDKASLLKLNTFQQVDLKIADFTDFKIVFQLFTWPVLLSGDKKMKLPITIFGNDYFAIFYFK